MGFKIESLWAYISIDQADGDEGVLGIHTTRGWMPLVAADKTRLDDLRPFAEEITRQTGVPVQLVQFTTRIDIGAVGQQPS